jgi:secreted trypsin-like serine protease
MKVLLLLTAALTGDACTPRYSPQPQCQCGIPLDKRRIVGGEDAKVKQYPWQVGLLTSLDSSDFICGGSLLSSDTVLTAAHCLLGYSAVYVALPRGNLNLDGAQKIRSSELRVHPYYTGGRSLSNDYAIVKLSTPVEFDETTQPICLPDPTKNYDDSLAEVTGWGSTVLGGPIMDILQTVNVTTITNKQCQQIHDQESKSATIAPSMLCAGKPGRGSCHGDSGGPMITLSKDGSHFSQIGVVSWGYGCGDATPGVYARVTDQIYWIIKQVSGETCAPPSF